MPTDLKRTNSLAAMQSSSARNARIVVVALTAALVVLQLVGLAMMERSHALPASRVLLNRDAPALCTEPATVPATQALYD